MWDVLDKQARSVEIPPLNNLQDVMLTCQQSQQSPNDTKG